MEDPGRGAPDDLSFHVEHEGSKPAALELEFPLGGRSHELCQRELEDLSDLGFVRSEAWRSVQQSDKGHDEDARDAGMHRRKGPDQLYVCWCESELLFRFAECRCGKFLVRLGQPARWIWRK